MKEESESPPPTPPRACDLVSDRHRDLKQSLTFEIQLGDESDARRVGVQRSNHIATTNNLGPLKAFHLFYTQSVTKQPTKEE